MTHLDKKQEECLTICYTTGYINIDVANTLPHGLISVSKNENPDFTKKTQQHLKVTISVIGQLLAQAILDRRVSKR